MTRHSKLGRSLEAGFSLVEMMIAAAIFGLVAIGAYVMMSSTQELSAMAQAKSDAERQSLLLLQRIAKYYTSKKPGDVIEASKATDQTLFRDYSCNKCLTPAQKATDPKYKSYSFSLHHDTEGCRTTNFPTQLLGCKGISIARGMWTDLDINCGCAQVRKADVFTAVTKCQKISGAAGRALRKASFWAANGSLSECTQCKPGERPVVIENRYDPNTPATAKQWRVYPDGAGVKGTLKGTTKVADRNTDGYSFLFSNTAAMEFCTHLDGDTVMLDVNSFFLSRVGSDTKITKVKQQTSFPKNIMNNADLRFIE